jgi:hypothetical protein
MNSEATWFLPCCLAIYIALSALSTKFETLSSEQYSVTPILIVTLTILPDPGINFSASVKALILGATISASLPCVSPPLKLLFLVRQ